MNYCFFDTETTGVPRDYRAPLTNSANWPRLVQLAWTDGGALNCVIVRPEGFEIPAEASEVHGITHEQATTEGEPLADVIGRLLSASESADFHVGHNIDFDVAIVGAELHRLGLSTAAKLFEQKPRRCTMKVGTDFCRLPGRYGYKWPRLHELYAALFGRELKMAHRVDVDVAATVECYLEMERRGLFGEGEVKNV